MQNSMKRLSVWAGIVGVLLLIPLIAMQFTSEVEWDLFDFIFMGGLLFGAGLVYELVAQKMTTRAHKIAIGAAIVIITLLIWVEAAVGIFS